jgi:hypothetical protein
VSGIGQLTVGIRFNQVRPGYNGIRLTFQQSSRLAITDELHLRRAPECVKCAESAYVHGAEACDARIVPQTRKGGWARAKRTSWKGLAEQEDRKIEIVIIREGSPKRIRIPHRGLHSLFIRRILILGQHKLGRDNMVRQ